MSLSGGSFFGVVCFSVCVAATGAKDAAASGSKGDEAGAAKGDDAATTGDGAADTVAESQ